MKLYILLSSVFFKSGTMRIYKVCKHAERYINIHFDPVARFILSFDFVNKKITDSLFCSCVLNTNANRRDQIHIKRTCCSCFVSLLYKNVPRVVHLRRAACAISNRKKRKPNKCNRLLKQSAHVPSIRYIYTSG